MRNMLDRDHIRIRVKAADWEEAIRRAGSILAEMGSIQPSYIESMIQSVRDLGPYIVILPGLALAHAAPGDAVKKSDISLITLDTPVNFGSPNDPVSVVLCLACTDSSSHLEHLSRIAEILMEEHRIEEIAAASDASEITCLFQTAEA